MPNKPLVIPLQIFPSVDGFKWTWIWMSWSLSISHETVNVIDTAHLSPAWRFLPPTNVRKFAMIFCAGSTLCRTNDYQTSTFNLGHGDGGGGCGGVSGQWRRFGKMCLSLKLWGVGWIIRGGGCDEHDVGCGQHLRGSRGLSGKGTKDTVKMAFITPWYALSNCPVFSGIVWYCIVLCAW